MEYASLVLVHVFFAIIWGGGAISAGLFIIPSVMEAGPAGGSVIAGLMKRRFPVVMSIAAFLVILSGIRLFTLQPLGATWFGTPQGIVLTLGALLGHRILLAEARSDANGRAGWRDRSCG